jgi:peptidyl-prolyl cis-trans isomerase SurA
MRNNFIKLSARLGNFIFVVCFIAMTAVFVFINSAIAQNDVGIAAIVDDTIISSLDLKERIKLAMFASNLPYGKGFEEKIKPQVLKNLIDERLYMQEAEKLDVSIAKEEMDSVVADIEKRNNIQPGKFNDFLKFNGISATSMTDQIKAQLTWNKVIARKIRPQIFVTEEDVNEKIENIARQAGSEEVNISEILLLADNAQDVKKLKDVADNLIKQLKNGGDFAKIAKQFSKASSAQNGGNVGWIRPGQINDEAAESIKSLKKGQISKPLPVQEAFGYTILKLNDRRSIAPLVQEDAKIGLKQAFVKIAPNAKENERSKLEASLQKQRSKIRNCDDFSAFAKAIGSESDPKMTMLNISSLADNVKNKVVNLKVGEVSSTILAENGLNIYMVCEKPEAPSVTELKNTIRDNLANRKLSMQANKYLRELYRGAFIEIRNN